MSQTDEPRPEWPYAMSRELFTYLDGHITGIQHHRKMVSADMDTSWIKLTNTRGERKMLTNYDLIEKEGLFKFRPYYGGLIETTRLGYTARVLSNEISAWNRAHQQELEQYAYLKKKFGGK